MLQKSGEISQVYFVRSSKYCLHPQKGFRVKGLAKPAINFNDYDMACFQRMMLIVEFQ